MLAQARSTRTKSARNRGKSQIEEQGGGAQAPVFPFVSCGFLSDGYCRVFASFKRCKGSNKSYATYVNEKKPEKLSQSSISTSFLHCNKLLLSYSHLTNFITSVIFVVLLCISELNSL